MQAHEEKKGEEQKSRTERERSLVFRQLGEFGLVSKKDYKKHKQSRTSYTDDDKDEKEEFFVDDSGLEIKDDTKEETVEEEAVPKSAEIVPVPSQRRRSVMEITAGAWQSMINLFGKKPYRPSPELIDFLAEFNLTPQDFQNTPMPELDQLLNQGLYGRALNAYASNHLLFKLIAYYYMEEAKIKSLQAKTKKIKDESEKDIETNIESTTPPISSSPQSSEAETPIFHSQAQSTLSDIELEIIPASQKTQEIEQEKFYEDEASPKSSFQQVSIEADTEKEGKTALDDDDDILAEHVNLEFEPESKSQKTEKEEEEQEINTLDQQAKDKEKQPQSIYCTSRVWPRNKLLLFDDQEALSHMYMAEAGVLQLKVFNRLWSIVIFTLLANDIYSYYQYPDKRFGNTLVDILFVRSKHAKMLSNALTSITVWPELIGLPLLMIFWSMLWRKHHPTYVIPSKKIEAIRHEWRRYQSDIHHELIYPLLRFILPRLINKCCTFSTFPDPRYDFQNLEKTILWDGRVSARDRIKLFKATKRLLERSSLLLRIELLTLFESFAENIHPQDIIRLFNKGYDLETIKTLLYIQGNALDTLKKEAQWSFKGFFYALYAHFLLWNIGQPKNHYLEPLFWLFQTFRWYATINFLITLGQGVQESIQFYLNKRACENQGKLWTFTNPEYECTVCGDLPIPLWRTYTLEDCVYAWFQMQRRTASELIHFFENRAREFDFSTITTLNLERQFLNGYDLKNFLNALKKHAPHLQELDLNMTRKDFTTCYQDEKQPCEPLNYFGIQAIADFIREVPIQTLDLRGQFIQGNDMKWLGPILNQTNLRALRLDFYYIGMSNPLHGPFYNPLGDNGATYLAQGLIGSKLEVLNLDYTNIGNVGVQALAQHLNRTHLQELDLANNPITTPGGIALGQGLHNSTLRQLDLGCWGTWYIPITQSGWSISLPCENRVGSIGTRVIAENLPHSSLQILSLYSNSIGETGAQYLAEALPHSSLQRLDLGRNSIGETGAQYLAEALPHSSLQILYLSSNSIGETGAQYLAQALPHSSLQILYLSSNSIGDTGAQYLAQALPHSSLQILSLSSNSIGETGAQYLADSLPYSSLQLLDLSSNSIGETGAQYLAEVLPHSSLQILYLSSNSIGDTGAQYLAQYLPYSELKFLNLYNNDIQDNGTIALARSLIRTPPEESYLLWIQSADPELKKALHRKYEPNTKLEFLSLVRNDITDIGARALCEVLPFTEIPFNGLDLSGNNIYDHNILTDCGQYSAASRTELPLPFKLLIQLYRTLKKILWPRQNQHNAIWIQEALSDQHDMFEEQTAPKEISFDFLPRSQNNLNPALPDIQTQNNTSDIPVFAAALLFGVLFLLFFKKFFNTSDDYSSNHRKKKRTSTTNLGENINTLFCNKTPSNHLKPKSDNCFKNSPETI